MGATTTTTVIAFQNDYFKRYEYKTKISNSTGHVSCFSVTVIILTYK